MVRQAFATLFFATVLVGAQAHAADSNVTVTRTPAPTVAAPATAVVVEPAPVTAVPPLVVTETAPIIVTKPAPSVQYGCKRIWRCDQQVCEWRRGCWGVYGYMEGPYYSQELARRQWERDGWPVSGTRGRAAIDLNIAK